MPVKFQIKYARADIFRIGLVKKSPRIRSNGTAHLLEIWLSGVRFSTTGKWPFGRRLAIIDSRLESSTARPFNDQIRRTYTTTARRPCSVPQVGVSMKFKTLVRSDLRYSLAANAGRLMHDIPRTIIRHDFCSFVIWQRNHSRRCNRAAGFLSLESANSMLPGKLIRPNKRWKCL